MFNVKNGKPYCRDDYYRLFVSKCSICDNFLEGHFLKDPWGNSYCEHHTSRLTACTSCSRLICDPLTGGGVQYSDGRAVCNLCRSTAVDTVSQGVKVLADVKRSLELSGISLSKLDLSLKLVDRKTLNDNLKTIYTKNPAGMIQTRVQYVNGMETSRKVESILALYGLPADHLAVVLAHELGHAYLFIHRFPELQPQVEEGFAELCSYLLLSKHNLKKSGFRMKSLLASEDPIYGRGLKKAIASYQFHSLEEMLSYMKKHKKFP